MFTKFAKRLVAARKRSLSKPLDIPQSSDNAIDGGHELVKLRNSTDSQNGGPNTEESALIVSNFTHIRIEQRIATKS